MTAVSRLEERFWPTGSGRDVWMLVDAARDRRIFGLLLDCFYSQRRCLFSGTLAPEIEVVAPYLVQLEYDDEKTRRFLRQAWGNSWGVCLKCNTQIDTLRRHLRRFLLVRDPAGRSLMFRYYDPRVLRVYLPTCGRDELRTVFGPIERFWMEDAESSNLLEFGFNDRQLVEERHTL